MPSSSPSAPTPEQAPFYEVVLCSYNGEDYILEQLTSIASQKPPPATIIISDDGSTDDTLKIVERFAHISEVSVRQITGPGQGIIQNALSALKHTTAAYVFLADQDDIWLDNKAALFCAQMRETDQPHLIFSDAWVWWPQDNEQVSFWKLDGLVPEHTQRPQRLAFHNAVQGASACINRALIERTEYHSDIAMHDWWLGLIASGTGEVSIIREPTLLYRQHETNQVGSQTRQSASGSPLTRLKNKRAGSLIVLRQAAVFAELYASSLSEEPKRFFTAYTEAISGNLFKRLLFLLRWRPVRKNAMRTTTLWLSIAATRCSPIAAQTKTSTR